jgi:hypothetical protein
MLASNLAKSHNLVDGLAALLLQRLPQLLLDSWIQTPMAQILGEKLIHKSHI